MTTEPTPPATNPPAPARGPSADDFKPVIDHWKAQTQAAIEATAAEKARADAAEAARAAAEKAGKDAVTEAEKGAERRLVMAELRVLAKEAGIVDLDVLKLADTSKLKIDDAGEVAGAADFIAALKTAKPYAFKAVGTATGTTTGGPAPGSPAPGGKMAKDMTPEEYKAARAELTRSRR